MKDGIDAMTEPENVKELEGCFESLEIDDRPAIDIDPLGIVRHAMDQTAIYADAGLQWLLQTVNATPEQLLKIRNIRLSVLWMHSRVYNVTELYAKEDATTRLHVASYDIDVFLNGIAEQINEIMAPAFQGSIRVTTAKPGKKIMVQFDGRRVSTILFQLISNALLHGGTANKSIWIRYGVQGDKITISVKDKGRGIPTQELPELFHVRQRALPAPGSTLLPPAIFGLGLPLCKKFAREMGGDIVGENQKVGAKFTLCIPCCVSADRVQQPQIYIPDPYVLSMCMASVYVAQEAGKIPVLLQE